MKAKDILTLNNISYELTLLEKNLSPLNQGDIRRSIEFYENNHKILYDPELQDEWVKEEEIDPETNIKSFKPHLKKHTRLCLPYPQQIVMTATAFLLGKGIDLILTSNDEKDIKSFDTFNKVWRDSNIITLLRQAAKRTFIETRSAISFFYDADTEKIKGKLLCLNTGYNVYRHKDENEKMDAVIVNYLNDRIIGEKVIENIDTTDIYLKDKWYRYENLSLVDGFPRNNPDGIEKLLFAYFEQEYPEYWFVMDLIDKQNYARSQHSDVNVRIGNPAIVVYGKLAKKPKINDAVKIYEIQSNGSSLDDVGSKGADMKYLEIASAPESVKLEMDNNERDIYRFTYPDLYQLIEKAISGNLSSKSMMLMFTHVFAKIAEKQVVWDDMIKRVISILKKMSSVLYKDENINNLNITFKYNSLLPSSIDDLVNTMSVAVGSRLTTPSHAASQLDFNDPETIKTIRDLYDESLKQAKQQTVSLKIGDNNPPANPSGVNGQ